MTKRETPTLPPPPNSLIALEIETRADRLANIREQLDEQIEALRKVAARLRGERA